MIKIREYKLYFISILDYILMLIGFILKECQLDKKIDKLPEKYSTFIYNKFIQLDLNHRG